MSRCLPGTILSTAAGRGWSNMAKPPGGTAGGKTAQHHRKQRPARARSPSRGSKHRDRGGDAVLPMRGKGRVGCKRWSLVHQLGTSTPRGPIPDFGKSTPTTGEYKATQLRNPLEVQWLGLGTFPAGARGSIPGWGTKIMQALWCSQKESNTSGWATDKAGSQETSFLFYVRPECPGLTCSKLLKVCPF